jgi:nitrogen PTS system EIIA component
MAAVKQTSVEQGMQIESLLTRKRTLSHAVCSSKKRALEALAELIAKDSDNIDANELFQHFIGRERLGSTGIGDGIAIPHCRFKTKGATIGALMVLDKAIDFDAVDSKPVDIIFAMLVPEDAESSHLQALATLAERLQKPEFVKALRLANTEEELFLAAINTSD